MYVIAVVSFGGVSALPIRAAETQGAFKAAGVIVEHSIAPSSAEIRQRLLQGDAQVAHLAPDNVISWTDEGTPIRAWLAGSNGPIALLGRGVQDAAGLRGKRVGVDSVHSGFVTILHGLLEPAGLGPGDVVMIPVGATRQRYAALLDGRIDATMLTLPWSRLAQRDGATELADHRHVSPGLLTSCAASLRPWLAAEPELTAAYATAWLAGLEWLRDGQNRDAASRLLAQDLGLEADLARDVLGAMDDPVVGWPSGIRLTASDLAASLTLRAMTRGAARHAGDAYTLDMGANMTDATSLGSSVTPRG